MSICRCTSARLDDFAAHVLTAADRGFDLAMTVGAFGDLYLTAVIQFEAVVDQRSVTLGAGGIDRHPALVAFVSSHFTSFVKILDCI